MNRNHKDTVETKPKQKKSQRTYYDAAFKLKVVRLSRQVGCIRKAAKMSGVDESNLRRWIKNYERLLRCDPKRKSSTGPKQGKFTEIDQVVLQWILEQREKGFPVSRRAIKVKALREARNRNIPQTDFKASYGWCRRLMRRSGLSLRRRTTIAQKLPTEKLIQYQKHVIKLRKLHNYPLSAMGNADETPVYFDMPGATTVHSCGQKTVTIRTSGNEKLRVSVMLTALADGTKLPRFVILKRKTMPKEDLPKGIFVRCNEKGWMTANLMEDWLKNVWNKRPDAAQQMRAMLVLDSFRGHITNEVKQKIKSLKSDLVIIPGGLTSILQVIDVVINKPFKDSLKKLYEDWLLNGNHTFTRGGNIRKPTTTNLFQQAWDEINPNTIIRGFKKCCVSNDLDGTEDDTC